MWITTKPSLVLYGLAVATRLMCASRQIQAWLLTVNMCFLNKVRGQRAKLRGIASISNPQTTEEVNKPVSLHHAWQPWRKVVSKRRWNGRELSVWGTGHVSGRWVDSLARLADLALGALPACPPQRGRSHVQAHPMVVLTAAGAEELVRQLPRAIAQRTISIVCNYGEE